MNKARRFKAKRRRAQDKDRLVSLSRKDWRMLQAYLAKWRKKLKPMHDAIEASRRITAEDLRIIVK